MERDGGKEKKITKYNMQKQIVRMLKMAQPMQLSWMDPPIWTLWIKARVFHVHSGPGCLKFFMIHKSIM